MPSYLKRLIRSKWAFAIIPLWILIAVALLWHIVFWSRVVLDRRTAEHCQQRDHVLVVPPNSLNLPSWHWRRLVWAVTSPRPQCVSSVTHSNP